MGRSSTTAGAREGFVHTGFDSELLFSKKLYRIGAFTPLGCFRSGQAFIVSPMLKGSVDDPVHPARNFSGTFLKKVGKYRLA